MRATSRTAAVISAGPGRVASSRSFWYGIGCCGCSDACDRRVELPEAVLRDVGRDLGAEAAELDRLVDDDEPVGLRDGRLDRGGVERDERARVDDLDAHTLRLELVRDAEGLRHRGAERDDGHVRPLPRDGGRAEVDRVALLRHGRRVAEEEQLLLEEDDRVVVLDRRREQALRVEGIRRHHDDEPRDVGEERLEALRVLGAEPDAGAADHPDHERHRRRAAHHEAELRGLVRDLVEGDGGEVGELELDDGAQAGERGADRAADEAALGQRRVADAVGPEALVQALRGAEEPADAADVLAHHDHVRVGGELELERLADRRHERERPLARRGRGRVAAGAGRRPTGAGRRRSRPRRRARSSRPPRPPPRRRARIAATASSSSSPLVAQALLEPRQRVPALPLLDDGRIADVRAGSPASSAACAGTSSARGATGRRRPGRGRAPPRRRPRPRRRRCRRRPRPASRSPPPGAAMSSTARCVRQSAESANWLFSQMKTTGSFQVAARFIPSWAAPWPAAPSPKKAITAWPLPRSAAVSAGTARVRDTGADDAVAAEDVEREVGDVHRAAEPLAVAGALAEHLGHHPAQVGAGRDQVAVRAVVADEVVALAHHARRADGDRLLADAAVGGAEDDALLEELLGAVLEDADQPHPPVLLDQRRPAGGPLPLRGGRVSRHEAAAGGTRRRTRRGRASRGSCRPCSARPSSRPGPSRAEPDALCRELVVERVDLLDEDAEVTGAVAGRAASRPTASRSRGTRAARPASRCPGSGATRCRSSSPPGRRRSPATCSSIDAAPDELEPEQAAVELERPVHVRRR